MPQEQFGNTPTKINDRSFASQKIVELPQLQQAQYDTDEQVRELLIAGNKLGLYDAVDLFKKYIINK